MIYIARQSTYLDIVAQMGKTIEPDKIYDIEIRLHREKRSKAANAYAWELIGKLADKLGISKIEVYREHIKDVGVYRQLRISEPAYGTFVHAWAAQGIGWVCEKLDTKDGLCDVAAYYGSSTYTTKQMSRFLDNIVQDCKDQGIETDDCAKIEELVKEWNP